MPGSTLRGQCPKGEATRLPAGSQETGSTTKVSTAHPFVQACPAHQENCCISRAAQRQSWNPSGLRGGRGQKVQNKPTEQRLRSQSQARYLNKAPGTVPICGASGSPQEMYFLMSLSFFKVVMVHTQALGGEPLTQLHQPTTVYM